MEFTINSEAYESSAYKNSIINYGLFTGSLTQNFLPNQRYYDLTISCLYREYVCAYSCQATEEERSEEVLLLLKGLPRLADCPLRTSRQLSVDNPSQPTNQQRQNSGPYNRSSFINTGFWISTVVFVGIAIGFAGTAASFSIINVLFNPVEPIFSVFGLYIWNGAAIGASALSLILWGSLFASTLTENIAVTDTLTIQLPYNSEGLASLGFSYWFLLLPIGLHATNVVLLIIRRYVINREPPPTTIDVDSSDLTIIMY
ncbi:uncharacterized protein LOC128273405 isoform X2 [Anopheles cruzii]|uniref:uncharacterized protein LOC128273405 isoform X2 n=1 Tax=Anopheles cruzii TaxID=68878 RepID=UPI0022EC7FDF|nr:uncharacterized protein LOC128273405 isoform X2 [Anopheles cruzii]